MVYANRTWRAASYALATCGWIDAEGGDVYPHPVVGLIFEWDVLHGDSPVFKVLTFVPECVPLGGRYGPEEARAMGALVRGEQLLLPDIPDGRLFLYDHDPDRHRTRWLYRKGFVYPQVVDEMAEIGRHLARSAVIVDVDDGTLPAWLQEPHRQGEPFQVVGRLRVHMDIVRSDLRFGRALSMRRVGPASVLFVVREGLISPELVREYNDVADGLLKTVK